MNMKSVVLTITLAALLTAGHVSAQTAPKVDHATAVMKGSFKARGQAKLDRLEQDETMALCSKYPAKVPADIAKKIESTNLKLVKLPSDGKLLGDWKEGEKIAQSGVGFQFSDDPKNPVGGNCYACHQLSPNEISYGTIGPSLLGFGKLRGNTEAIQKYTFGKIYNAQAYSACSNMPRFGHNGVLSELQIKHLTALLLDPNSPVNK
jgi:sulfur-oxidizing protein SoxX